MAEQFSEQAAVEQPALTGRATLGATIGNMLEFYDFIVYSFFDIQIGRTFFPSQSEFASLMLSLGTFVRAPRPVAIPPRAGTCHNAPCPGRVMTAFPIPRICAALALACHSQKGMRLS
jgi:hypothetical protein